MSFFKKNNVMKFNQSNFINSFTIIIPTFNEESSIYSRIQNLLELDYPYGMYEIIIVDSNSSDNTASVVSTFITNYNQIHPRILFIQEKERLGKAHAIEYSKQYAEGEIILIADANSVYSKNVLLEIGKWFADKRIGAVSGKYAISNAKDGFPVQESFYWFIEDITLKGESAIDSISTVIGTISAWRKDLVKFSSDTITEDLDMTLSVRDKGYLIKYEPNAIAFEPAAMTKEDQIIQRRRTSLGTIQNIFKYFKKFIHIKKSIFLITFTSHKILPMFSPFIILGIIILYIYIYNIFLILINIMYIFVFSLILLILLFTLNKSEKDNSKSNYYQLRLVPKIIKYILLNEYIIILAWKDLLTHNYSLIWEKTTSTRTGE